MNTADQHLRTAQALYRPRLGARLRHTSENVLQEDLVFVETTLADQPHKLASVASGPFLVMTVDPHTVPRQRSNTSYWKMSFSRGAEIADPRTNPKLEHLHALYNGSRILDLPARHLPEDFFSPLHS